jgi:hypothetical protein
MVKCGVLFEVRTEALNIQRVKLVCGVRWMEPVNNISAV